VSYHADRFALRISVTGVDDHCGKISELKSTSMFVRVNVAVISQLEYVVP